MRERSVSPWGAATDRRAFLARAVAIGAAAVTAVTMAMSPLGSAARAEEPSTAVSVAMSEAELRSNVHARLAVFVDDAVDNDYFSDDQRTYILSAISTTDPESLSSRQERRVVGAFWRIITESGGVTREQAERRLSSGATLQRIAGEDADAVRSRLRDLLVNPVLRAIYDREISWGEAAELLTDTRTAVNRLMAQPGGNRGDVILVPRRS